MVSVYEYLTNCKLYLKVPLLHGLQATDNNFIIADTTSQEAIKMLVIYSNS